MLIKSTRAETSAGARRLANHILRGAGNENITVLRGAEADIDDAFRDARHCGNKFAIRHFIIAPAVHITLEQVLLCVAWLGAEFGFDPMSALVVEHQKQRIGGENNTDRHYHVLVSEIDPTGKILSSKHNFARQEKLSKIAAITFGHPVIPGKHNAAVITALRREGKNKIADDLEKIFAATADQHPREAYTTADHQRTARQGIDLPFLRDAVADIWKRSDNRASLVAGLGELSLVIAAGHRDGVYVVRTTDGVFIGSLARLVRARKAEIITRMETLDDKQLCTETKNDNRGGNLSKHEGAPDQFGADSGIGSQDGGSQRTQSDRSDASTAGERGGRAGATSAADREDASRNRPVGNSEIDQGGNQRLVLELELAARMEDVIDLLGPARIAALDPLERVAMELWDFIETQQAAKNKAANGLPEPKALQVARRVESDAGQNLEKLRHAVREAEDALEKVLARRGPAFFGRSQFTIRKQADEQKAQVRIGRLKNGLQTTERVRQDAESHRQRLDREYRADAVEFSRFWQEQAKNADRRVETARFAKNFVEKNPILARWGSRFLYQVSAALMQARQARCDDGIEFEMPDLVPAKDIWGIPYQPRPR